LFPPSNLPNPTQNCPNGEVLSWNGPSGTVECTNPTSGVTTPTNCPAGQVMTGVSSGTPTCVPLSTITNCPAGQVMAGMSSGAPICVTPPGPTDCGAGQALTYTPSGFACVTVDEQTVPTCGAGQFLTSNGSGFTCTNTTSLSFNCPAGQALTGISSGSPVCSNLPSVPACNTGQYVAGDGNQLTCVNLPTARCSTGPMLSMGANLSASSVPTGTNVTIGTDGCGSMVTYVCDNGAWPLISSARGYCSPN